MTRNRASIEGGYVRKTVSLPSELQRRIQKHLDSEPGLTMSMFMTVAGDMAITKIEKRKGKK